MNKYNRFLTVPVFLLTLVLLLNACKVSKDYQRPVTSTPATFRHTTSFGDTAGIASIPWKQFFNDTTLQSLIEKGIARNNDLLVALKNTEIAAQRAKQAKLLFLPSVTGQIAAQTNRPSSNSITGLSSSSFLGSNHIEDYLLSVNLSWEIDIWGKLRRQKESTLAQYLQTYEASKAVQTRLVADIAQGYYNLLMLDKQLRIAKHNLLLSDTTLLLTRLLKDAGETNLLSVQQVEAQRESIAVLIPQLEQDIALQENALQLLAGDYPDTLIRNTTLDDIAAPQQSNAGLPAALVSRRPDVRAAEMEIVMANAKLGVATADMYPSFSISASGGLNAFRASDWFSIPGSLFGVVGGALARPIFSRGALKTNYEVAKIEKERSVLQFRQSVLNAVGEVSNALVQTNKLKERELLAQNQVNILQGAINNARLLYKSNMANYLEVIAAQSNALQAELNLAFIRSREWIAVTELYRSLGGGWE
jgi:multidrug efflux system outer membrane protein